MKRTLLLAALAFTASMAQAAVVNFDDLTGTGILPANYGGINWQNTWSYYDYAQAPYTPSSGSVRIYSNGGLDFLLPANSTFDGAFFAGNFTAGFNLYLSNVLVHSTSSTGLSSTPTFLASGYAGVVDRVEVVGIAGFFVMDDVTYNSSAVPEPSTYAMLASATALAGFLRRRK